MGRHVDLDDINAAKKWGKAAAALSDGVDFSVGLKYRQAANKTVVALNVFSEVDASNKAARLRNGVMAYHFWRTYVETKRGGRTL